MARSPPFAANRERGRCADERSEDSMRRNFAAAATLLALALLAPLPSFAIGRDLTPVRIATPAHYTQFSGLCATATGFLLRWGSETRPYGTTTDAEGVPRLP